MRIFVTPTFVRVVKKLHPWQKTDLDEAVRVIANDSGIGETKVGDIAGVQVYKFRMTNQMCLVAYRVLGEDTVKLLIGADGESVIGRFLS